MSTLLMPRSIQPWVLEDLKEKMVLIGGPRQVGKTTLTQQLGGSYFNWDESTHRKLILAKQWPAEPRLVILDELHKYARWRNFLKGAYDTQKQVHSFVVTGSARMDHYRRGGDSLLGRYHYYRLHPFTLSEVGNTPDALEALLKWGGFPEPFFKQSERTLRRWQLQRLERVIREDLRDLERVREISLLESLAEELPTRVGSPLSLKALAGDLGVDFKTARHWLEILENLYFAFRISPYGARKIRAVKKEQKLYLWDWSTIESEGPRFENLVASHLLKYCHFQEDVHGHRMELRFLRDFDKREIDFVVLKNRAPLFAVECKSGGRNLSPHIPYFEARTSIPLFYQVHRETTHRKLSAKIELLPFVEFCKKLELSTLAP